MFVPRFKRVDKASDGPGWYLTPKPVYPRDRVPSMAPRWFGLPRP